MLSVLPCCNSLDSIYDPNKIKNNYNDLYSIALKTYNNLQQINKLDMTKYDSYKNLSDVYMFKSMKYHRTKEFEADFLKNPNEYTPEVIIDNRKIYKYKNDTKKIAFSDNKTHVICITYYRLNPTYSFTTTKTFYNKILYGDYAYNMNDYYDLFYSHELYRFRNGILFDQSFNVNVLDIYNSIKFEKLDYFNKYIRRVIYTRYHKSDILSDLGTNLDNSRKRQKICHLNGMPCDRIEYSPYSDIEKFTNVRTSNCKKNIITTYGICWSTTINNFGDSNNTEKKTCVTQFTNTDDLGNIELDCSIGSSNNLLSLEVANKKIDINNITGYKIVNVDYQDKTHIGLLQLDIPSNALIATYDGDKFRCNKCTPTNVSIVIDNNLEEISVESCQSKINNNGFIYYMNKECYVGDFNGDLKEICVPGIHYYLSKKDAIKNYGSSEMQAII